MPGSSGETGAGAGEVALTRRQRDVFRYLFERHVRGEEAPKLDTICEALAVRSRGSLHKHVQGLVAAGLVEPMQGRQRGVRLSAPQRAAAERLRSLRGGRDGPAEAPGCGMPEPALRRWDRGGEEGLDGRAAGGTGAHGLRVSSPRASPGRVPLLGRIAAGSPLEALPDPVWEPVPSFLCPAGEEAFLLQVRGDSMVDAGIEDGDYLLVRRQDSAADGDVVVALIDEREATVKRILQTPEGVELRPANPAYPVMRFAPARVRIQGVVVGQMRAWTAGRGQKTGGGGRP